MVGIGFAWASILSLPYAMLCDCLPAKKMGIYMGIFNFFIVIPQLLAASVLGVLLKIAVRQPADLCAGARRRQLRHRRPVHAARAGHAVRRSTAEQGG